MGRRTRAAGTVRVAGIVLSTVLAAGVPTIAWSQDNPPITVPTDPVPQGQPPPPTGTAKPPPQPTTTAGGGGSGGSSGGGGSPAAAGSNAPSAPTSFNNEGVFKVSGSKGPGIVGGPKSSSGATITTGGAPAGKPKPKVFVAAKPKEVLAIAEWPGFRMTDDGGSEVMVEFSKPLGAPTEHKAAGTITYIFTGAHFVKYNNANPLLTIHFNTPVLDARLVQKKGGELHLVVDLRPGLDLAPIVGQRVATDTKGQQFFVKFPSGSYLPADDGDLKKPDAKTEQGKTKAPSPSPTTTSTTKKPASGSGAGPKP